MEELQQADIDIRDEFFDIGEDSEWWDIANLTLPKLLLLISMITGFGLYVGSLLFGVDSLSVLNELKQKEKTLTVNIEKLKEENAKLQKEYFELKGLEPQ